jgi:hypothetical protein
MTNSTRREFLIATAGVGVYVSTGLAQTRSPNEKLNLGFIGLGGRGNQNLGEMAGENVAALCDVDERHLGKAAENHPKARQFRDFRKMIDEAKDLDAVVIATPHHIHAPATAKALREGKHVLLRKAAHPHGLGGARDRGAGRKAQGCDPARHQRPHLQRLPARRRARPGRRDRPGTRSPHLV